MQIELAEPAISWDWIEGWAQLPPTSGHSHHGMAIDSHGRIISAGAGEARILILNADGQLLDSFETPVKENHGIDVATFQGQEAIFIADNQGGEWAIVDFQGKELGRIGREQLPGYEAARPLSPTAISVDRQTGDIWLADGYGSSLVHKFDADLQYQLTLDGSNGAGRFKQPHWVYVDHRRAEPRIYVADRANDRVQVFTPSGDFITCLGEGVMRTPSAFTGFGEYLVVAELKARLVLLDGDDQVVTFIGDGFDNVSKPGWPNRLQGEDKVPPADLVPGRLNSPHGIAADGDGNIYISEWLLGDRFIKLQRR